VVGSRVPFTAQAKLLPLLLPMPGSISCELQPRARANSLSELLALLEVPKHIAENPCKAGTPTLLVVVLLLLLLLLLALPPPSPPPPLLDAEVCRSRES